MAPFNENENPQNEGQPSLNKGIVVFFPPAAIKAFGFEKKDVKATFNSLASRLLLTSLIASLVTLVLGIVFSFFLLTELWPVHKHNVYIQTAPYVLIGGGLIAFLLLLFAVLSKKRLRPVELAGDLIFRFSLLLGMLLFFLADLENGDLNKVDAITSSVGILLILVICQPGYLWEAILFNVSVVLSTLVVVIYGVLQYNMYCLDQYILFLIGYLICCYFIYCSFWYVEAQRHYISTRNADLLFRSTHDTLTSARNRQGLRFYLNERLPGWRAKNESLLVIMLDIDDFKLYNDTFGHLEGDEVLTQIVQAIETSTDVHHIRVFRYGGEEFLLLRSKVDKEEAEEILESIRSSVEKLHFPAPLEAKGPYLTVSLGGSLMTVTEDYVFHDQVDVADKALYQAKGYGKNQFVLKVDLKEPPKEEEPQVSLLEEEK